MKKLLFPCIIVLGAFLFSGCDKFNDERFSTTIIQDFDISVTDNGGSIDISLDSTLTAMINEELEAVKDDIEKYELVQIKYKIWEYNGDPSATFIGSMGIGNANSTIPGVSYEFNDISLKSGNDDPNSVLMTFNSSEIDKIEQYFLDTNGLKLYLEGNVSHVPMSFVLQVSVDVDAIANVKK